MSHFRIESAPKKSSLLVQGWEPNKKSVVEEKIDAQVEHIKQWTLSFSTVVDHEKWIQEARSLINELRKTFTSADFLNSWLFGSSSPLSEQEVTLFYENYLEHAGEMTSAAFSYFSSIKDLYEKHSEELEGLFESAIISYLEMHFLAMESVAIGYAWNTRNTNMLLTAQKSLDTNPRRHIFVIAGRRHLIYHDDKKSGPTILDLFLDRDELSEAMSKYSWIILNPKEEKQG